MPQDSRMTARYDHGRERITTKRHLAVSWSTADVHVCIAARRVLSRAASLHDVAGEQEAAVRGGTYTAHRGSCPPKLMAGNKLGMNLQPCAEQWPQPPASIPNAVR